MRAKKEFHVTRGTSSQMIESNLCQKEVCAKDIAARCVHASHLRFTSDCSKGILSACSVCTLDGRDCAQWESRL